MRIVIVGEHAVYRDGLQSLLEAESDLRVVGQAADCSQAAGLARRCRPDILLADFLTPTPQLSQELHALTAAFPTARIVVLTLGFQKSQVAEALRFGVRGIVLKNVTADVLFKSIRIVAAGEYWIERDVLADLVHDSAASSTADARRWTRPPLTDRERQIISLLVTGRPNKEIADKCGIRERTVKHHLTNVFDKLGVSSRLELVLLALHERLVDPDGGDRPSSALI